MATYLNTLVASYNPNEPKMCFMITADEFQASDTTLILSPLRTPAHLPQAWQLTYINTIQRGFSFNQAVNRPLMIIPIPNPHHLQESQILLFPVQSVASELVRYSESLTEGYEPEEPSLDASSFSSSINKPQQQLQVQKVGNYQISVAPNFDDLETRAPWQRFKIKQSRLSIILRDLKARYSNRSFAFVIAECLSSSFHVGFSVVYRDARSNGAFFPTSHEAPEALEATTDTSSFVRHAVQMDVNLIAFNTIIRPLSLLSPTMLPSSNFPPGQGLVRIWANDEHTILPNQKWPQATALHRHLPRHSTAGVIVEHERPQIVSAWKFKRTAPNGDVLAKLASHTDVHVVQQMYEDLDAWLRLRFQFRKHSLTLDKGKLNVSLSPFVTPSLQNDIRFQNRTANNPLNPTYGSLFGQPDQGNRNNSLSNSDTVKGSISFGASSTAGQTDVAEGTPNSTDNHSNTFGGVAQSVGSKSFTFGPAFDSTNRTTSNPTSSKSAFLTGSSPSLFGSTNLSGRKNEFNESIFGTSQSNVNTPFSYFANSTWSAPIQPDRISLQKVSYVLSLLARQLADPGINDRVCDVASPVHGQCNHCGPVSYHNLDLYDIDLDQEAYVAKESWARYIEANASRRRIDTTGSMYVRISAIPGPVESASMRTVCDSEKEL